jgi:hypothetical protein
MLPEPVYVVFDKIWHVITIVAQTLFMLVFALFILGLLVAVYGG